MTEQKNNESNAPLPEVLPILPLRDTVVFPLTAAPLAVGQERSLRLVEHAASGARIIGVVAVRDPAIERGEPENVFLIGTTARIQQLLRVPDGTVRLLVQGVERIRITEFVQREPFLAARYELIPETVEQSVEVEALVRQVQSLFQRFVTNSPVLPDELATAVINIEAPLQLAYFVASNLRIEHAERQQFLAMDSVREKLEWLLTTLTREVEVLELGKRIQSEAQEHMGKAQREYYLREQLKAIRKELGEGEEGEDEIRSLREKLDQAGMPEEARKEAERELARLEKLNPASPEHSVIRTYLDWLIVLPWSKSSGGKIDVTSARRILDEDHYDLEKVKKRIVEYLAVRKLNPAKKGPILCLVGPPGVGKTSLGQ